MQGRVCVVTPGGARGARSRGPCRLLLGSLHFTLNLLDTKVSSIGVGVKNGLFTLNSLKKLGWKKIQFKVNSKYTENYLIIDF